MNQSVILGTGPLGLAVMDELLKVETDIVLVNRSGRINEAVPKGVKVIACDLLDTKMLEVICSDAENVYMCAVPPYHKWVDELEPMINSILEAVKGKQLIYGDNLYMYGKKNTAFMDEETDYDAMTNKGKVRKVVAGKMMDAMKKGDIKLRIARASDFYGPRVKQSAFGVSFFRSIAKGKSVNVMGDIDKKHSITYIRDFAKTLVAISKNDKAHKTIYHVPNMKLTTVRGFGTAVAMKMGSEFKPSVMPLFMMKVIGVFIPALKELIEMQYQWKTDFVSDHSRASKELEISATPMEDGINETINWINGEVIS